MLIGTAFINKSGHIKKYEDNYEDRGFCDPNSQNLSQHKNIFVYSWHYLIFPKYPHKLPHIVDIITRFK